MLIIKGAVYQSKNELLIAHRTGEYFAVDCTNYRKFDAFREAHDRDPSEDDQKIEYEGKTHYSDDDYRLYYTSGMKLLSDLSKLEHDGTI